MTAARVAEGLVTASVAVRLTAAWVAEGLVTASVAIWLATTRVAVGLATTRVAVGLATTRVAVGLATAWAAVRLAAASAVDGRIGLAGGAAAAVDGGAAVCRRAMAGRQIAVAGRATVDVRIAAGRRRANGGAARRSCLGRRRAAGGATHGARHPGHLVGRAVQGAALRAAVGGTLRRAAALWVTLLGAILLRVALLRVALRRIAALPSRTALRVALLRTAVTGTALLLVTALIRRATAALQVVLRRVLLAVRMGLLWPAGPSAGGRIRLVATLFRDAVPRHGRHGRPGGRGGSRLCSRVLVAHSFALLAPLRHPSCTGARRERARCTVDRSRREGTASDPPDATVAGRGAAESCLRWRRRP
ncbi:hypothetical protein GCM10010399_80860 [Dactylosporangium fulvum]|uniref:Uncharacterized protein n=1 Tax=Dactylosporangium fulvum TaxID=53359 RepID=A0ABY5VWK1_9ACTN|nr:hypothetical protein [Dactylosporangium fulvum]UWP81179.1 hypothetical protein Dfulv_39640 [Dactylosporangium fulvum]